MARRHSKFGDPIPGIDAEHGSTVPPGNAPPLPHPPAPELPDGDGAATKPPSHTPPAPDDIVDEIVPKGLA